MLELPSPEATSRIAELERPQEVRGLLEVGTNGIDLVNQVFHAHNAVLAEDTFDKSIIGQSDALLVDLAVSTLVDELANGLEVGIAVGDVWFDDFEHLKGGLGHANEHTIVDLEETKELEDLARLGGDLVDTIDSEHNV